MRRSKRICPALPESTPPSQNMPPLDMRSFKNLTLPQEYTPLLYHYMRHSYNLPLPPRIYICDCGTLPESTLPPIIYSPFKHRPIYTRASRNLLLPSRIYPQPFSTMWLSQNLPLSPAWISVHAVEGAYRGPISSMGIQCVQCIRTVTVPPMRGFNQWWIQDLKKGGAQGFGGLPPRFLGYILANLGDFLKNSAKIGGGGGACCYCVSFILTIYVQTLALRWAWRTFYVPAGGGGGCERTQRTPPAYGPAN